MNFFALIIILFSPFEVFNFSPGEISDWELIKSSDGVKTYERWIKINDDLTVREQKGVMEVDAGVNEVMDYLKHAPNMMHWMAAVEESYLIKKKDANNWYTYTRFGIPWPIGDRDLVAHYHLTRRPDNSYYVTLRSIDKYVPQKPNVTRFLSYYGHWEIKPLGKKRTQIVHVARSHEAPAFPRYLQDPIIRSTFLSSLKKLKTQLE